MTKARSTIGLQRRGRPCLQRRTLPSVLPLVMIRTGKVQYLTWVHFWPPKAVPAMQGPSLANHPHLAYCLSPPVTGCPSQWTPVTAGRWWPFSSRASSRCKPERNAPDHEKKKSQWSGLCGCVLTSNAGAVAILAVFKLTSMLSGTYSLLCCTCLFNANCIFKHKFWLFYSFWVLLVGNACKRVNYWVWWQVS